MIMMPESILLIWVDCFYAKHQPSILPLSLKLSGISKRFCWDFSPQLNGEQARAVSQCLNAEFAWGGWKGGQHTHCVVTLNSCSRLSLAVQISGQV